MSATVNKIFVGKYICSHCQDGKHEKCPRVILNGGVNGPHLLQCPCTKADCPSKTLRCRLCRNTTVDDVNPQTWTCLDESACSARVQRHIAEDPLMQRVTISKERAMAEKAATKVAKKETAPKEGKCIVTGVKTKGGLFAPGMDARFVSIKVASVIEGEATKTVVIKEMKDLGVSDVLIAKFEKNLGLAQERKAAKVKAAKAKADAKKAAKADKAA